MHIKNEHYCEPDKLTLAKQYDGQKSIFDPELVKDWDFVSDQGLTQPILDCYTDATILPDSTVKF